ncbi:glycosyltransferase [Candidatus Shapirobacteria bacterium]|nr:glycosyltransferase [Candidatus Shapirobacteria bacterium]
MRIALIHDYLKEYGGAERVLETLHEIWPQSEIYTAFYFPRFLGPHRQRIEKWSIKSWWVGKLPLADHLISPLRLFTPHYFSRLNLTGFDVVIVSATGAYQPNLVQTKKGAHFCYCHTPPRFLYGYPTARNWQKHWWGKIAGQVANHFLRQADFEAAQKVDYFLANSKNTAARIKKFYRRESRVVYPPIDVKKFIPPEKIETGDYFLAGGRLARAKRIDLAIEACVKLKLPLKVFGRSFGDYGEELKKLAQKGSVEFLGEVGEKELVSLYQHCRAFIFPAQEEDFGIMPVEAMAAGRPVIALSSGGVLETVIPGKTGEFFEEPTVSSLVHVLANFNDTLYKSEDCVKQAQKFSKERFKKEIKEIVARL